MQVTIELNERLYKDIVSKSNNEGIEVGSYLSKIIEDKFYTDKYGDLNLIEKGQKNNGKTDILSSEEVNSSEIDVKATSSIKETQRNNIELTKNGTKHITRILKSK